MQIRRSDRRAEAPDEADEIFRGQRLVPEHQYDVVEPGFVYRSECLIVQLLEIEAAHLGAERGLQRDHFGLRPLTASMRC